MAIPTYWRLDAIDGQKESVDPAKHRNPEAIREKFSTEAAALARKADLKAAGMIACVMPVYSTARANAVLHKTMQTSPFGEFANGWKMAR